MKTKFWNILYIFIILNFVPVFAQDSNKLKTLSDNYSYYMSNQNYDKAIDIAKEAETIAPHNCFIPFMIGSVYYQTHDYYQTIEYYNKALLLADENTISSHSIECLGDDIGYYSFMKTIYNELADCYTQLEMPAMSIYYDKLNVMLNLHYGNYIMPTAESLEKICLYYLSTQSYIEGFHYVQNILYLIPDNNGAWNICRAIIYAAMGDFYLYLGYDEYAKTSHITAAKLGHIGARNLCLKYGWNFN